MTTAVETTRETDPTPVRVAARAAGVSQVYGSGAAAVRALDAVDVDFAAGAFTAFMGPSGSG